jgi:DNA replication protein DnaC
MTDNYESLKKHLIDLSLKTVAAIFEEEATKAAKAGLSYTDYLKKLIEEEIVNKTDRSINAKIAKAKFPQLKTLEMFEFSFQPSVDEKYIRELAHLGFMDKAENIVFLGPPGVGKTHLAIALGIKACFAKKRVLFMTASELADDLVVAYSTKTLADRLAFLCRMDLLVIDELGYLPLAKDAANLFFQLISRRYEHGSIILTSNKSFGNWGETFAQDATLASAIIDRLLHYCHIFQITGKSYRIKNKLKDKNS